MRSTLSNAQGVDPSSPPASDSEGITKTAPPVSYSEKVATFLDYVPKKFGKL